MKLTIPLMTRGRPQIVTECLQHTIDHLSLDSTRVIVLIDEDDPATREALKGFETDPRVILSVKPREDTRGEKYDRALTEAPADVYMPAADYVLMGPKGFDEQILEAASLFPDGIGCVYTGLANESFPTVQAITAGFVKKTGYIYPPWFPYWFIDHWVDDVAKMIDRISYVGIVANRHRNDTGKTIGMRDVTFWSWLFDAGRLVRRNQARDIIDSPNFQEPEWRKEIMRRHYPFTEYRSYLINHSVRANAKAIEESRGGVESFPDKRYLRIKAKAETLMRRWVAGLEDDDQALEQEVVG